MFSNLMTVAGGAIYGMTLAPIKKLHENRDIIPAYSLAKMILKTGTSTAIAALGAKTFSLPVKPVLLISGLTVFNYLVKEHTEGHDLNFKADEHKQEKWLQWFEAKTGCKVPFLTDNFDNSCFN